MIKNNFKFIAGGICVTKGFLASAIESGIKKNEKDLALIFSPTNTLAALCTTQNSFKSESVKYNLQIFKKNKNIQAVLINSGNANCGNGNKGLDAAKNICLNLAKKLNISVNKILFCSTGVIGEPLPVNKIILKLDNLKNNLSSQNNKLAAEAILTTDTKIKEWGLTYNINKEKIFIGGMAKGAGMIFPHMGTMLCFLTTNINISQPLLQQALKTAVDESFNAISVDGDTSPSDTVIILSNCTANNKKIITKNTDYFNFLAALKIVCLNLAKQIIADAEGATKFITINIKNAKTKFNAKNIAMAIANSMLFKSAMFGEDPNWGRILVAAGSKNKINFSKVVLYINNEKIFSKEKPTKKSISNLRKIMQNKEINIILNLHNGKENFTAYTCDLSYEYVKINAEYRS